MKKNLFYPVIFFALILLASGCKKTETQTQTVSYSVTTYDFNMGYNLTQYTQTNEETITVANVQQAFISSGLTYDVSKVNTSKLTSIVATAQSGSNFDQINSIQVYLKVEGAGGDGIEIAHAEGFTTGTTTVNLTIDAVELKNYLSVNSVVTFKVTNRGANMPQDITFNQMVIKSEVQK